MHAQGSKRYGNPATVARPDFTVSDQRSDLPSHVLWIDQHGAGLGPWRQRAIRPVSPVGKGFGGKRMAGGPRRLLHRRSGAADEP